jgi:hypothetical protein
MPNQNDKDSSQRRQQGGDRSSQTGRQQQQENRLGQMGDAKKNKSDQGKQQR